MTLEEAQELLENADSSSCKEKNRIRRGLEIFEKYEEDVDCSVGHDAIYASEFNEAMTKEDILALDALGWHISSELKCWAKFV